MYIAEWSEHDLHKIFSQYGNIVKCRLVVVNNNNSNNVSEQQQSNSNNNTRYGLVMYDNIQSAQQAINSINNTYIDNKYMLKVTYKNIKTNNNVTNSLIQSPTVSNIITSNNNNNHKDKYNLYIAGLPLDYTTDDLINLFSIYGNIIDSRIKNTLHSKNALRGNIGFVRYDNNIACINAIESMNNKYVSSKNDNNNDKQYRLTVRYALDKNNYDSTNALLHSSNSSNNDTTMPNTRTTSHISLASLDSIHTIPANNSNLNTPHSIHQQQSQSFILSLQPQQQQLTIHDSNSILPTVDYTRSMYTNTTSPTTPTAYLPYISLSSTTSTTIQPSTIVTLFVCHLATTVTDYDLYTLFSPYGSLHSVCVMRDLATSQTKGYGFINYYNVNDANNAMNTLNNTVLHDKTISVSFKKPNYNTIKRYNSLNNTLYDMYNTTLQQPTQPYQYQYSIPQQNNIQQQTYLYGM